eukprot:Rmarinus@m.29158
MSDRLDELEDVKISDPPTAPDSPASVETTQSRRGSIHAMSRRLTDGFQTAASGLKTGTRKVVNKSTTIYKEKMPVVKEKLGEAASATKHGLHAMNEKVRPLTEKTLTHVQSATTSARHYLHHGWHTIDRKLHAKKYASRPTVVCFGDSLTQLGFSVEPLGWGALLQSAYNRKADVLDRGFSGYNTRMAVPVVPMLPSAALYIICFGANDAALTDRSQQGIPVDEYADNLTTIVRQLQRLHHKAQFLLVTPPAVDPERWRDALKAMKGVDELTRSKERTEAMALRCCQVAQDLQVPVVNLHAAMLQDSVHWAALLSDGLHLSTEGNLLMFREISRCISEAYPALSADSLSLDMPLWEDMDFENPDVTVSAYIEAKVSEAGASTRHADSLLVRSESGSLVDASESESGAAPALASDVAPSPSDTPALAPATTTPTPTPTSSTNAAPASAVPVPDESSQQEGHGSAPNPAASLGELISVD